MRSGPVDGTRGKKDALTPPAHLRPATGAWWAEAVGRFELEGHHVRLLTLAGEAWDRAQQARAELDAHGLTYTDRFGAPRTRPEVAIERDSRIGFARLIRDLNLDAAETPGGFVGGDD